MIDPLTLAREALAEYDRPRCGALHGPPDAPGLFRCSLDPGHDGDHEAVTRPRPAPGHLRAALAELDRLSGLVARADVIIANLLVGNRAGVAVEIDAWIADTRDAIVKHMERT